MNLRLCILFVFLPHVCLAIWGYGGGYGYGGYGGFPMIINLGATTATQAPCTGVRVCYGFFYCFCSTGTSGIIIGRRKRRTSTTGLDIDGLMNFMES